MGDRATDAVQEVRCEPTRSKPYWFFLPSGSWSPDQVLMSLTMGDLKNMKCEACQRGAPRVTGEESRTLHEHVRDWTLVERGGIQRLERNFSFGDFADALAFTNSVGALAEEERRVMLPKHGGAGSRGRDHPIEFLEGRDHLCRDRLGGGPVARIVGACRRPVRESASPSNFPAATARGPTRSRA